MTLNKSKREIDKYEHKDKERLNNPHVGLVTAETDSDLPKSHYNYDPHLDPELKWDSQKLRDEWEFRIRQAANENDPTKRKEILEPLLSGTAPWLEWAGKAEHTSFEVDTVSLHVHERIDPYRIIDQVRKDKGQTTLNLFFEDEINNPSFKDAIEFYKHKQNWTNRLIAGDSLLVMNSLLEKEGMAGKVQMIYIDPPYGVKYNSNFQPFVNKRDVKDGKDEDLTQEPEMIKAYRDTWELGIHSYLTYLRDRLLLARELLTESGSVFVQISDENVHHVREIMDEVFGKDNFVSLISFIKTGSQSVNTLPVVADYIIWYCRDISRAKYHQLMTERNLGKETIMIFPFIEDSNGKRLRVSDYEIDTKDMQNKKFRFFQTQPLHSQDYSESGSKPYLFQEKKFTVPSNRHWTTSKEGMDRLSKARRIEVSGSTIRFIRYYDEFPASPLYNIWTDTTTFTQRKYIVETNEKVIERCILMSTDPGDLVLDPTCGSGTTAYVAEKWGRRWITLDTSRIAITLAKQRIMVPIFDYYELAHPLEGIASGFIYQSVPHSTLKSIANNEEIDILYSKYNPKIESELNELNKKINQNLKEWEVSFDWNSSWDSNARSHFENFWRLKREMQKEMNESISKNAPTEILYDKPLLDKSKIRVSGPFTVESVPSPMVKPIEEIEKQAELAESLSREGESLRIYEWMSELQKTGVRGKEGEFLHFSDIYPIPETKYIQALGETKDGKRTAVSFGQPYSPLDRRHVEMAVKEAQKLVPTPSIIIFASFQFDPEAAKDIDQIRWPNTTLIKVQMNTDLLTNDLKKKRSSNESFWLVGQPDVELKKNEDGKYQVEVNGFDYYNPVKGEVESEGKEKIAMWMLDTDYDDRSIYPSQIFFPMASSKDGWSKLAKTLKAEIDEEKIGAFHGTVSLPFTIGPNNKIAVKIVDDRGIESLKILEVD